MASLEQNLREVFSQVGVQERKQLLANIFLFPSFDEEDDLRTSIVLDVYYDALFFLVNHGFPWREVVKFFEIFRILWQEIQGAHSLFCNETFSELTTHVHGYAFSHGFNYTIASWSSSSV